MTTRCWLAVLVLGSALGLLAFPAPGAAQLFPGGPQGLAGGPQSLAPGGYLPVVRVLAPGRLDWTIVNSPWSLDPAPAAAMAGYASTAQTYELYVPPRHDPRQPYGMILHIPTGVRSDGWAHWR